MLNRYVVLVCLGLFLLPGMAVQLGPDAEVRMINFWIYVWDEVDDETKAVIVSPSICAIGRVD